MISLPVVFLTAILLGMRELGLAEALADRLKHGEAAGRAVAREQQEGDREEHEPQIELIPDSTIAVLGRSNHNATVAAA